MLSLQDYMIFKVFTRTVNYNKNIRNSTVSSPLSNSNINHRLFKLHKTKIWLLSGWDRG